MNGPLCRYCGKPIAKQTRTVWLETRDTSAMPSTTFQRSLTVPYLPETIADCRAMTNWQVVSVRKTGTSSKSPNLINRFNEWDGQAYVSDFFCNDAHARKFAYLICRTKPELATTSYHDAVQAQKGIAA